jgi:hypothetical protein
MTASDEVAVRMIDSTGVCIAGDTSAAGPTVTLCVGACADRLILSGNVADTGNGLVRGNAVDSGCGTDAGTALDRGAAAETGNVAAVSFPPGSVTVLFDGNGEELCVRVRHTIADARGLSGATRISEVTACRWTTVVGRVSAEAVLNSVTVPFFAGSARRGETVCRDTDSLVCLDSP